MVLAVHAGHCRDKNGVIKWMIWTIIGGIAFLGCQAWEWTHLHHQGAWWGSFTDSTMSLDSFKHLFRDSAVADPTFAAGAGMRATHDFYNYFFRFVNDSCLCRDYSSKE